MLLDNIEGALGSPALAGALTATAVRERMLGESRTIEAPMRAVFFATGNNLSYRGDLGRRVVPIEIDPAVEFPEERDFRRDDLRAYVGANRPALVTAALTLLRAFHLAGRPRPGGSRMGSFEAWDDLVRGCCVWSGAGDPCAGRATLREEADTDLDLKRTVFAAWFAEFGDEPRTVAEALAHSGNEFSGPALREAFSLLARGSGEKQKVDARAVGTFLRGCRNVVVDGLRLEWGSLDHTARRWRVISLRTPARPL